MEESLKARLIGAAVLVAIAVLLIPELLSGRKAVEPVAEEGAGTRGTRSFTIELGGASGEPVRSPTTTPQPSASLPPATTPVADLPEAASEPDADSNPQSRPVAESERAPQGEPVASAVQPPATAEDIKGPPVAATPSPRPAAAVPAAGGAWAVQVGAFGSAETARKLVKDLTGAGYRAYVAPVARGGKTLHRVRVGPEADKASAEQVAQRLKGRGLPATVVPNE
jgi:DedD protein